MTAELLDARSAGIKDLLYGYSIVEEWAGRSYVAVDLLGEWPGEGVRLAADGLNALVIYARKAVPPAEPGRRRRIGRWVGCRGGGGGVAATVGGAEGARRQRGR